MPASARGLQAGHELQRHIDGGGGRQRTLGGEAIGQRALHQLHGDGRHAVDLGGAEHEHAVLVIDRRGEAALALEALALALVAEALLQHLERDAPPALDLLGFVDEAHAAAAEHPAHPVAAELGAGRAAPRPIAVSARRRPSGVDAVVRSAIGALLEEAAGPRRVVIAQQLRDVVGEPRIACAQRLEGGRPLGSAYGPAGYPVRPSLRATVLRPMRSFTCLLPGRAEAARRTRHGHGGALASAGELVAAQRSEQEDARLLPVALHGPFGEALHRGNLDEREAAEELQVDDEREAGIDGAQLVQGRR